MTQPRKPSGPGEWRKGDWLVHKCGAVGRILSRKGDAIICDCEEDHIVSRRAYHASFWSFLARPVENDPEGWVAHDGGPNPAPGMRVDLRQHGYGGIAEGYLSDNQDWRSTDDGRITHWRPSIEYGEHGRVAQRIEPSASNREVAGSSPAAPATPDTPRPADGDDLIERLRAWGYAPGRQTAEEAATALGAANRRIAELEGKAELYDHMKLVAEAAGFDSLTQAIVLAERTLKAEARLAEAGGVWGTANGIPEGEKVEVRERDGSTSLIIVGSIQWRNMLEDLGPNVAVRRVHSAPDPAGLVEADRAWLDDLLLDQMDQSLSQMEEHGPNEHDARIMRLRAAVTAAKEQGGVK